MRSLPHPLRRASPAWALLAAAAFALGMGAAAQPGTAASSGAVVSMEVVGTTYLTNECTTGPGRAFGVMQPGSNATTSTVPGACRVAFGSSNSAAELRISQADGTGTAMGRSSVSWANSQDEEAHYSDAVALGAAHGWAIGPDGHLARTMDAGATWTEIASAGPWYATAAAAPGTTGPIYAAGLSRNLTRVTGVAAATPTITDIGANLVGVPAAATILGVAAPTSAVVFVAAEHDGTVYVSRSTDSGASFAPAVVVPGMTAVRDMAASTANDAWLVGDGAASGMFRTTTGGSTAASWVELASPVRYFHAITATSPSNAYATAAGGDNWRWDGTAWSHIASASASNLRALSASSAAPNTVWAVGDAGSAWRSTDGGLSWARITGGQSAHVMSVATVDGTAGILVGDDRWAGFVTNGTDVAGSRIDPTARSLVGLAASPTNGQRLIAVGSEGTVRRSTNGGASWTTQASGTTRALYGVDAVNDRRAWAVGDRGTILHTGDGGLTWAPQAVGITTNRLLAVDAVDDLHAWAVGDGGTVLRTANGGSTWALVPTWTTRQLGSVAARSGDQVVVGGSAQDLRTSTDGGATWLPASVPDPWQLVSDVEFASPTHLFASTGWRDVLESNDGGVTWAYTSGTPPTTRDLTSIEVLDDDRIAIAGGYAEAFVSDDGGASWELRALPDMDQVLDLELIDEHTLVGVGRVAGQANATMTLAANETIDDYGAAPNDWAGAGAVFGVCLQSLGDDATATGGWFADADTCTPSDTDPWRAVPATGTAIATTPFAGAGSVDLVWGMRAAHAQLPGRYSATVAFEVLSP